MLVIDRVNVTNHAIVRWRERVAVYGDEGVREIHAALRLAVHVPDSEPLPFARKAGTAYYRHHEHPDVYFVLDDHRLVTVTKWLERKVVPVQPMPPGKKKHRSSRPLLG